MDLNLIYMVVGFMLAAYSVVSNDSIQTLGTFLSANQDVVWWKLWLAASSILVLTLGAGWYLNGGDIAFGRLSAIPWPQYRFNIWHVIAPASLLLLTRSGIPVSTTFLVLSVFASSVVVEAMIMKSILGYAVAGAAAFGLWFLISKFIDEHEHMATDREKEIWRWALWLSTGFLFASWLSHDAANIAVYLPRVLDGWMVVGMLSILVMFLGYIFYTSGGKIQDIVLSKTGTRYVRSAAIINFAFAAILYFFKELNGIPMSTTFVFIGCLTGRELAIAYQHKTKKQRSIIFPMVIKDFLKIMGGLVISLLIAFLAAHFS